MLDTIFRLDVLDERHCVRRSFAIRPSVVPALRDVIAERTDDCGFVFNAVLDWAIALNKREIEEGGEPLWPHPSRLSLGIMEFECGLVEC